MIEEPLQYLASQVWDESNPRYWESKELHESDAAKKKKYEPATKRMRELIDSLKPGNVTDVAREMKETLDAIIKEMQCR